MEPNIDHLLQKYGISPKDQQNNYSSNNFIRLHAISKEFENKSQTTPATPLQDKINLLESKNLEYESEIQRLKSEVNDLKSKLNNFHLQKQKEMTLRNLELDSEFKLTHGKLKTLEGQNAFLKTQLEFYEEENKRSQEQYYIDKENWILQCENLKRQLQYKQIDGSSTGQSVKIEKEENKALRDQISRISVSEKALFDENCELKKLLERDKQEYKDKIQLAEREIKSLKDDYEISLQEIQHENEKLKNICGSQNASVAALEKKIAELENANIISEEARESLKKQQEATRYFIKDVVSVNKQLTESLKKEPTKAPKPRKSEKSGLAKRIKPSSSTSSLKGAEKKQRNMASIPSYLNQEYKMQLQIQELENEVAGINMKYKELLKNPQDGSFDYQTLKSELDSVAKALDEKGKELFSAKRRYSSIVRDKMMRFDS